jgi:enolase
MVKKLVDSIIQAASGKVTIQKVHARQIFDSRGNPTVEVEVTTQLGTYVSAVPSGASTGIHEAHELRDGGKAYMGKGVLKAVANVKSAGLQIIGMDVTDQKAIDTKLLQIDGTPNKEKLGANAILGISMAVCQAGAAAHKMPLYAYIAKLSGNTKMQLPVPCLNIINGGKHAENGLSVQEFMIVPNGASTFSEAMQMGSEVYHHLKKVIHEKYGGASTAVGDEGGFAPNITSSAEAVKLVKSAIKKAGYEGKISLALDAAASEFCNSDGTYTYEGKKIKGSELAKKYVALLKEGIISLEDPFDQDDFVHFAELTGKIAQKAQVVGDDLTVTNPARIQMAAESKACNALLLKINQIGSITEAIEAAKLAKSYGWSVMVSHRSGETEDTFIADFVVGIGSGQIKTGAPARSERLAKYNRLLRIEEELGTKASYAGKNFSWAK